MKNITALFTLLLLVGCSSQPRQVVASRALVEHVVASNYQSIPQQYWNALDDDNTTSVDHEQEEIQLKASFISALGYTCRNLYIAAEKASNASHRIACKIESQWYLMPAIVEGNEVTF